MASKGLNIPSLDGIRALSFLVVFVAHCGLESVVPGGFGVTAFFFLSGYLITTLMRVEYEKSGTVGFRRFYLRRVLRILPPFYLVLVAATVLAMVGLVPVAGPPGATLQLSPVLAQFLHYTNYWGIWHGFDGVAAGTPVYWSLAVEEHFYLVFPLIYLGLRMTGIGGRRQAWTFLAFCALVLAWRLLLVLGMHVSTDRTYMGSDTRFDSIFFGCALAVGMNPVLDRPVGPDWLWKWVLFPAGLVLLVLSFAYRAPWFRETLRYTLQGIALTPVFVAAVLAAIGVLSYSLYLLHHIVILTVHQHLPRLNAVLQGLLSLAVSIALAKLIYRFVEKPCAEIRKRLESGPAPAAVKKMEPGNLSA
jgi:peptidoglycan/LPS O-acetylase OafA/YrhL